MKRKKKLKLANGITFEGDTSCVELMTAIGVLYQMYFAASTEFEKVSVEKTYECITLFLDTIYKRIKENKK
jgi:hypothetical protein